MKIINKVLKNSYHYLNYKFFFKKYTKENRNKKKYILDKKTSDDLIIFNKKHWIKKFIKASYSDQQALQVAQDFVDSEIEIIRDLKIQKDDLIAICVEKDDLLKLKRFINHHRKLGVNIFIILDNCSTDNTIKYLFSQNDVIILKTDLQYSSTRRVAWINRIIAHYGYDRWYFIADSDEILVYNDCEKKHFVDIINYCKKNNIFRVRALMIDMYAKSEFYNQDSFDNYYNECIYFDIDSYYPKNSRYFDFVTGGPRKRVFSFEPCLTKYPLVFFKKDDLYIKSHFFYPYNNNLNTKCLLVLKHYKLFSKEINKYKNIAKVGNYYNNSCEYKKYLKVIESGKLDFYYSKSKKYTNSTVLKNINIYTEIDWNSLK